MNSPKNYTTLDYEYDIHFMWYPASFSQSSLGNTNSSSLHI